MKKTGRRFMAIILMVITVLMTFAACGSVSADDPAGMQAKTAEVLYSQVQEYDAGKAGDEWSVIALKKSGVETDEDFYDSYYDSVCDYVSKADGNLSTTKYTEYARVSIALSCIGKDPANVDGYDLMKPAADFKFVKKQGISGPVFALIAANMNGYEPVLAKEDKYIDYILSEEISGGGFSLEGSGGSPYIDITAMAVQALSYYKDDAEVAEVIERAVNVMADLQEDGGGYDSSESISQTIIALTAAGVDFMTDERFVTDGVNLLEHLESYMAEDGLFSHEKDGEGDMIATEQVLCALDAVIAAEEGKMFYEAKGY